MRETNTDFKISDDFKTDWEHNKQEALDEMYAHAECIIEPIEHLIDNEESTLLIDNIDIVHKAIQEIKDLAEYNYTGERFNRWAEEYSDTFEYFFKNQVTDLLSDRLGYVWEDKS
jgi:hypothetical protein